MKTHIHTYSTVHTIRSHSLAREAARWRIFSSPKRTKDRTYCYIHPRYYGFLSPARSAGCMHGVQVRFWCYLEVKTSQIHGSHADFRAPEIDEVI